MTPPPRAAHVTEAEYLSALAEARPLLWHHARRIARGHDCGVEDLYQVAALWLWANRHKAAGHPNPGGWFIQAGRWAMLRERERLRPALRCDPDTLAVTIAATDPEPDEFDTLLAFAPERYRELLDRRFRGGEQVTDIATSAGVTRSAVGQQIERALSHVRRQLAG